MTTAAAAPQEAAPPAPAPTGAAAAVNQTLYVNNLNEKIKKDVLKKSIYSAFSQFGTILEIVCCRGIRLRGQAWVCFADAAAATTALRQMQGFPFYDKPMRLAYATAKSDVVARMDGTFQQREKRKRPVEPPTRAQQQPAAAPTDLLLEGGTAAAPTTGTKQPKKNNNPANAPPSNVLFAQELPEDCTDVMLGILFQQYTGFKEVRMVPGKKGIAFIEFADDVQASLALAGLNGFKLTPSHSLNLTFAKR
eukprot:CAMPEP_0118912578 /NCGR_PEP_ID=MMETSP1166-20130328/13760_1 /TAXON_ID=1104430 /ORGANISM="Chrysoreinhardia sp, Strain CCMP3193" /LENGTH=249 /DNA_ID=CAMNT_0006852099 /DNA_START=115 /DNA_END=864 /DNA_ORIENTATION=+